MNLLIALAQTPLTWRLEGEHTPATRFPERNFLSLILKVVPEPGAEPISMSFRPSDGLSVEQLLAAFFRQHLPQHPAYLEWRKDRGHAPVRLAMKDEDLEGLGEPMHTGLRKLAASQQSVITWNALHRIHPEDRVALWKGAIEVVRSAFAEGNTPTRYALAMALKRRLIEVAEERGQALRDWAGVSSRKPEQEFALRTLLAAMHLTEHEEWMWCWLGYVVQDLDP